MDGTERGKWGDQGVGKRSGIRRWFEGGGVGCKEGKRRLELWVWGGEKLGSGGRDALWEQWDIVTEKGGKQTNTGETVIALFSSPASCVSLDTPPPHPAP